MAGIDDILNAVQPLTQGVAGMGTVLTYEPLFEDGAAFPLGVLSCVSTHEERRALGGQIYGKKWVAHAVRLDLKTVTTTPETDRALFYALVDGVRAAWRDEQTLGGLTLFFGEDIDVSLSPARTEDGQTVWYEATLTTDAIEEITG